MLLGSSLRRGSGHTAGVLVAPCELGTHCGTAGTLQCPQLRELPLGLFQSRAGALVAAPREAGICRGLSWRTDPVLAMSQWELVTPPQPTCSPPPAPLTTLLTGHRPSITSRVAAGPVGVVTGILG